MTQLETSFPALRARRSGRCLTGGIVVRVTLAVVVVCLMVLPVLAQEPTLRGQATARSDNVTLGDLIEDVPAALAGTPVFRAPAVGETGTIQAARVVEAAARQGLRLADVGGWTQVVVTRAGRRIALPEIEAALKTELELRHQVDARSLSLVLDAAAPALPPVADDAQVVAEDVSFDPRSRRFSARIAVRGAEGRTLARLAGQAIEMAEIPVLTRALGRGETIQAGDLVLERRPRAAVPADAVADPGAIAGRNARRALGAGAPLRAADLQRPEIVARGEIVTIVYEVPGMILTLRGRANEAGAQGDVVAVVNPQSKRVLQATVVAPGKVAVQAAMPGPVAQRP